MINPYSDVDWSTYQHVVTTSHDHCKTQTAFNRLYNGGVRFFTVSNYYKSEPLYPEVDGVITGIETVGNDITVPEDCIVSANAEHHSMNIGSLHMNSLGSTFVSGSPRTYDEETGTWIKQKPVGMGGRSFRVMVDKTIENLLYPDGGGVTINHPVWSHSENSGFTANVIMNILDYSPYVLGQEVIECGKMENDARAYWDAVLITGRRSWGFFVPDHHNETQDNWIGRNILLVPEFTEHDCLKAYRNGEFYGRMGNTNLAFTNISVDGQTISIETNSADTITFIEDGNRTEESGSSAEYTCDSLSTYVRVEAEGLDDIIYSQPIIFRPYMKQKNSFAENAMLWTG